jgi:hypothetical protein
MNLSATETAPSDWDTRALCPDEACIGVLGLDGRCPLCLRIGSLPVSAPAAAITTSAPAVTPWVPAPSGPEDALPAAADSEPTDRELCPDESCIGLLGPSGACKLCGAVRPGSAPASLLPSTSPDIAAADAPPPETN